MDSARALFDFVAAHAPLLVLTGAGLSTTSGIPAYRDASGQWRRPAPIMHRGFLTSAAVRRRYWARSLNGWPDFAVAQPNAGHAALVAFARRGWVAGLVTQNVDGLHERAGSVDVIALHGRLDRVICLDCAACYSRQEIQERLEHANPSFCGLHGVTAPDGDSAIPEAAEERLVDFQVPACGACGGVLKPDVVFFGDAVPAAKLAAADALLGRCRGLLVVGSSLAVFSGFRLCVRAAQHKLPIAALNLGWTRADHLLALKLHADCPATLAAAAAIPSPHARA